MDNSLDALSDNEFIQFITKAFTRRRNLTIAAVGIQVYEKEASWRLFIICDPKPPDGVTIPDVLRNYANQAEQAIKNLGMETIRIRDN